MLRSGRSRNSQPEKTRRQSLVACSSTSNWRKAPVSCGLSHCAVRSQARRRMTARPILMLSPGRSVISRTRPLRLLSRPSTATRSAIGVTPAFGSSPSTGRLSFGGGCRSAGGGGGASRSSAPRLQPPTSANAANTANSGTERRTRITRRRASMPDNRHWPAPDLRRCQWHQPADRLKWSR